MKPAAEPSSAGEVVETTTRRRVVPMGEAQPAGTPDLWEYLAKIPATDWAKHMIYLYRSEPQPSVPLLKCADQFFAMPNGQRVSVADREEVEFALAANYGGGTFRIIVKKGAQWVAQDRIPINSPVRAITIPVETQNGQGSGPNLNPMGSDTVQLAGKAIDTIAGQEHQAVNIGIGALNAAANVVRSMAEGRPAAGSDMMQQFMAVAIQRLLTPPPDPLDTLTKLLAVMTTLNPQRGQDETTAQIMKAALDRLLNPAPSGAPVSATAELVRSLPQIGTQFVEGVRALAQAREAEARIVAMQRGAAPGVPQPNPQVLPPAAASATPAPTPNPQPTQEQSMEQVEQRIVQIFQQNISAHQAADEAMEYLDGLAPNGAAIKQLASLGEEGLLQFFHNRPVLKAATANPQRLVEFIRAFLKMHAEDVAAANAPAQPMKPLPN